MQGTGGFLNPHKVLSQLEIQASSKIADFGCGHGYFAIPLAELVGPDGQIFAVDVLEDALGEVKQKAERAGLKNISTLRGNLEIAGGSNLPENSCDMILLANILYQSSKKPEIIKEAKRVLKLGARLVVIDWLPSAAGLNSDSGWRISADEARRIVEEQNISFERNFDAGDFHYGLIFRKA